MPAKMINVSALDIIRIELPGSSAVTMTGFQWLDLRDQVKTLSDQVEYHSAEAERCAAMRDAVVQRLTWSNVNRGQAYVLRDVDQFELASLLVDAANKADEERKQRAER